jgi:hypothetical protein
MGERPRPLVGAMRRWLRPAARPPDGRRARGGPCVRAGPCAAPVRPARPLGRAPAVARHLHEELLAAHAERVEGAHAHQVLDDLDAHPRALAEVAQRAVRSAAPGARCATMARIAAPLIP